MSPLKRKRLHSFYESLFSRLFCSFYYFAMTRKRKIIFLN